MSNEYRMCVEWAQPNSAARKKQDAYAGRKSPHTHPESAALHTSTSPETAAKYGSPPP